MQNEHESKAPVLLFFGLWWMINERTPYADDSFLLALALMLLGWLSIPFFGAARRRLGGKAWRLLAEVAGIVAVVFWLYPAPAPMLIFWIWAALPVLLFAGAAARHVTDSLALPEPMLVKAAVVACSVVVLAFAMGIDPWRGIPWGAGAFLGLFYGWRFGERPETGRYDARMGDAASFRQAGVSDDT